MPTYEYQCEKCRKGFEIYQSMKDDALKVCPKEACRMKTWGKGKVKRQLGTGAGLIFKGSGFYSTDYRSEGYKKAEQTDTKAGKESVKTAAEGTKAESKTESKPATPTATPAKKTGGKTD